MKRELIARVAHEINRAYCASQGDTTQPAWEEAPDWQKDSALAGVDMHLANPDATPEQSHESWLAQKTSDGWKYGEVKDAEKKEHPCFKPYAELPDAQKAKDYLFKAVVALTKDLPDDAPIATVTTVTVPGKSDRTPIRYKGHREEYKDGAFGSGIVFAKGQTRMVPNDIASEMLKHKDVYELGETVPDVPLVEKTEDRDEEAAQLVRDQIASMTKAGLETFAKTNFSIDIDKKQSVVAIRQQVTALVDRFGVN